MGTCCITEYYVKSSEQELRSFYKNLDKWTRNNAFYGIRPVSSGFDLENILYNSGVYPVPENPAAFIAPVKCEGEISDYQLLRENGELLLYIDVCNAKGEPRHDMWLDIFDKYLPEAEIGYALEVVEDRDFRSNFKKGYILEYDGHDSRIAELMEKHFGDPEYFDEVSIGQLVSFTEEACDIKIDSSYTADRIIDKLQELDEDFKICHWEYEELAREAEYERE